MNNKEKSKEEQILHSSNDTKTERFTEDVSDKEWHVSHLRDLEFTPDNCEKTFEEKATKYRETLKNDAALVEFVSSDGIPANRQELYRAKCERNVSSIINKNVNTKKNLNINTTDVKNSKHKELNITNLGEGNVGKKLDEGKQVSNITKQRRSDYQFSSVEYYDEVDDFDGSICPDTVDIITLELDQLRSYDIQCEAIIEWRSLD